MTDPDGSQDRSGDESAASPGMPRWVKTSAIVAVIIVAILIVVMMLVGGEHGPGLHTGADTLPGPATPLAMDRPGMGV